jgi:hypothetical protein
MLGYPVTRPCAYPTWLGIADSGTAGGGTRNSQSLASAGFSLSGAGKNRLPAVRWRAVNGSLDELVEPFEFVRAQLGISPGVLDVLVS